MAKTPKTKARFKNLFGNMNEYKRITERIKRYKSW